MIAAMIHKSIDDLRRSTLWFAAGMFVYGLLIAALYPTVRDSGDEFQDLLDQYPQALLEAFGLSSEANLANYGVFVNAEYLSVIWPIIVAVYVVMGGAGAVAREIEDGTVELWLSVPAVRWKLLLGKAIALSAGATALALITAGANVVFALVLQADISAARLVLLALPMTGFALATLGIALLCSAFSDGRGRAAGIAAAIVLASYLFDLIAAISDSWDWLGYLSYFNAYNVDRVVLDGDPGVLSLVVLFCLWLAGSALSLVVFDRRDIVI